MGANWHVLYQLIQNVPTTAGRADRLGVAFRAIKSVIILTPMLHHLMLAVPVRPSHSGKSISRHNLEARHLVGLKGHFPPQNGTAGSATGSIEVVAPICDRPQPRLDLARKLPEEVS